MKTLTIDIETTGKVPKGAIWETDFILFPRIVSLAYKINDQITKHIIINQEGVKIPWEATAVHGITNEMCAESTVYFGQAIHEMIRECVAAFMTTEIIDDEPVIVNAGDYNVVGHNLYFDLSVIKANILRDEVAKHQFDKFSTLVRKEIRKDTMWKSIKLCGKMPKLTDLHIKLFGETFKAHCAKDDVDATYRCYVELVRLGWIQ